MSMRASTARVRTGADSSGRQTLVGAQGRPDQVRNAKAWGSNQHGAGVTIAEVVETHSRQASVARRKFLNWKTKI